MIRNALIALAGGTAIALTAPLGAQSYGGQQPTATQPTQPEAQPPAETPAADDQSAQATDKKAEEKAEKKAKGGTVVRAGPNAGQVIGAKSKAKEKSDSDEITKPEGEEQPQF